MLHRSLLGSCLSHASRSFATTRAAQAVTDPYKVLGVDKSADKAKIKKAYFNLAKQYHPDSNKDPKAKDRYVEVQEAYEILKDPAKKEQFDTYGAQGFDANGNPQASGFGGFGGAGGSPFGSGSPFGGGFDFSDLFSNFSNRGRGPDPNARGGINVGDAIEVAATISFMDAAKGATKSITIEPLTKCRPCTGSGLKPGEKKSACVACGGAGTRIHVMQGGFQMQMTCEVCSGAGIVIPRGSECRTCSGEGVVRERKTVKVDIPAGIEDGMRLRVVGEGDAPNPAGMPSHIQNRNGDLYVHIRIQPSTTFTREGPHLKYRATIPMTTAALGGRCRIPTLDGHVELKVAPGTNTGDIVTMSGKGMPRVTSSSSSGADRRAVGDLSVEFKVQVPKRVSPYERTLLEQLALSFGDASTTVTLNTGPARDFEAPSASSNNTSTTQGSSSSGSTGSSDISGTGGGIFSSIFDKYKKTTSTKPEDTAPAAADEEEPKKASG